MTTARDVALKVLSVVEEREAYVNIALRSELEKEELDHLDRAFASELVYGTVRYLKTIDWILEQFLKKPLEEQKPVIRNILRLGVYQVFYMDRVPLFAACNESASLARRHANAGAVKFVNGVLRNIGRQKEKISYPDREKEPVSFISIFYSHPAWVVSKWVNMFGVEDTIELCRANNSSPPLTVRTNTLKLSRGELLDEFKKQEISAVPSTYTPEGVIIEDVGKGISRLSIYRDGLFQVQDEGSMLAGHALGPEKGKRVLDMTSAPGGKTTHIAQLMGNNGKIVACDIYPHKIKMIQDNCRRLGIDIVETINEDAQFLSKRYSDWADYVLLDAPCSGLGVLRRRPDIKWRLAEEDIHEISELQGNLLEEAGKCAAPGGIIVYSTCTVNHEENYHIISSFLENNKNFELVNFERGFPSGIEGSSGGCVQLLPHKHNTDGFFIARLKKKNVD